MRTRRAAACIACHGVKGQGGIGPDLTDAKWLRGRGDYPDIVVRVQRGVPPDSSQSGQIMPPRGGKGISDDEARAVTATFGP